ncbi:MAG: hypothetical protein AAF235_06155, partial [Planctomycetota bacterium]
MPAPAAQRRFPAESTRPAAVKTGACTVLLALLACVAGCQPALDTPARRVPLSSGAQPAGSSGSTLAVLNGLPVSASDLTPAVLESAGAATLTEYALDALVARELVRSGLAVTQADIQAERDRFGRSVDTTGAASDPRVVSELVEGIRARRGLGPVRFEAVLRRSAGLRKLVAPSVRVDPAEVALADRIRRGPQHEIRVIITPDAQSATRARSAAASGIDAFAREARA